MNQKGILLLIFLLISQITFSQTDTSKIIIKKEITTQGEQEMEWMRIQFEEKYERQEFERYKGEITVINKTTLRYDEMVMLVYTNEPFIAICKAGIFYPSIIVNDHSGKIQPNSHTSLFTLDSLSVSAFEELTTLNPTARVKRFKLYAFRKGFANPSLYVFELTNDTATETTDFTSFIKGAKLTFFRFISILI